MNAMIPLLPVTLQVGTTLKGITLPFAVILSATDSGPITEANQVPNVSETLFSLPIYLKDIMPPSSL